MRKRTLVARLRAEAKQRGEVKGEDLVLAIGGIPTVTQDDGGKLVLVQGDTAQV